MPFPVNFGMCPQHVTCSHPYIMGRYCRIPPKKVFKLETMANGASSKTCPKWCPQAVVFCFSDPSIPEPSKGAAMFFRFYGYVIIVCVGVARFFCYVCLLYNIQIFSKLKLRLQ